MTCQWRIEAIEAQQRALEAVQDPAACEGCSAGLPVQSCLQASQLWQFLGNFGKFHQVSLVSRGASKSARGCAKGNPGEGDTLCP